MSEAKREMSLEEWCGTLSDSHRANRELHSPQSTLSEAVSVLEKVDRLLSGELDYEYAWMNYPEEPARSLADDVRDVLATHPELRQREDG